jgi:hypothetical protein
MHAEELCHKWLSDVLPKMHPARRTALGAVVGGAVRGGRLNVTSVGRFIKSNAKVKHNIKRADRLLSNARLQSEQVDVYRQIAREVVGANPSPIILVDWSDVDARRESFLLRAAVAVKGRSLTLYDEVHTRLTRETRKTQARFLKKLKEILPVGCKPIIVTDAGFRAPWFRAVLALGWDFVGRVRNRELVQIRPESEWIGAKSLYLKATGKPQRFSNVSLTQSNPFLCSLVLFKAKYKGRKRLTKMGHAARSRTSLVNAARAREPWLLSTSLTLDALPKQKIVDIYSTRMQIEESFRDLKCPRYGLGLYHNGTRDIERMKILVLIGAIANTFAWILGKAARTLRVHQQFQANTTTSSQVLSNVFIGTEIFRNSRLKIPWRQFMRVKEELLSTFC